MTSLEEIDQILAYNLKLPSVIEGLVTDFPSLQTLFTRICQSEFASGQLSQSYNSAFESGNLAQFYPVFKAKLTQLAIEADRFERVRWEFNDAVQYGPYYSADDVLQSDAKYLNAVIYFKLHGITEGFIGLDMIFEYEEEYAEI